MATVHNDNILPIDGAAFTASCPEDTFMQALWYHKKTIQDKVSFLDFTTGDFNSPKHHKVTGLEKGATYVVRIKDARAGGTFTELEVIAKSAPPMPVISEVVAKEGLLTARITAAEGDYAINGTTNFFNVMLVKNEKIYYLKPSISSLHTYELIRSDSDAELRALYGTIYINAEAQVVYPGSSEPSRSASSALVTAFMSNIPDSLRDPAVYEDNTIFATVKYPIDAAAGMPNTADADLYKMKFTVSGKKANNSDFTYVKSVDILPSASPSTEDDIKLSRQELLNQGFPLGAKLTVKIESSNVYSGDQSNGITFTDKRLIDSSKTSSLAPSLEVLSATLSVVSGNDVALVTMKSASGSASAHGIAIIGGESVIASTGQRILSFKFDQDMYSRKVDVLSDLLDGANDLVTGQDIQRSEVSAGGQAQFTFKVAIEGANDDDDSEVKGMVLVENIGAIKGLEGSSGKSLKVTKQFVDADQEKIEITASMLYYNGTAHKFGLGIVGDKSIDQLPLKVTYNNGDITEAAFDKSADQELYVDSQLSKKAVTVALSQNADQWKAVIAGHRLAMTAAGATSLANYTVIPTVSIAANTYPNVDALLTNIADISVAADYAVKVPKAISGTSVVLAGDGDKLSLSWTPSEDDLKGAEFVSFVITAELYKTTKWNGTTSKASEKTFSLSKAEWQSGNYIATANSDPASLSYELGQEWKFSGKLSSQFKMMSNTADGSETLSAGLSSSEVSAIPVMKIVIKSYALNGKGFDAVIYPMGNSQLHRGSIVLDATPSAADTIAWVESTKSSHDRHAAETSLLVRNMALSQSASKFFFEVAGQEVQGKVSAHNFIYNDA